MNTIEYEGRHFIDNRHTRLAIEQIQTFDRILAAPAVIYPNGRDSHEAAAHHMQDSLDRLHDFVCVPVSA